MKNVLTLFLLLLVSTSLFAQLELPQSSPKASVTYRVGLTDVTVNYSSPSVKKRAIFGALVPNDKVWRAGANEATNIIFSTDVMIGDVKVSKGRYAFFLIPKVGSTWTAIINSDFEQWGAYRYKEEKDIVRVDVKVEALVKPVEHLKFEIEERGIEQGIVSMEWERKRVVLPFTAETMKMALANIDSGLKSAKEEEKWAIHAEAADFLKNNNGDIDMAVTHINESVKLKAVVWNTWIQAQVLAKKGDYKGAIAAAEKVAEVSNASKDDRDYYLELEKDINASVTGWKRKK